MRLWLCPTGCGMSELRRIDGHCFERVSEPVGVLAYISPDMWGDLMYSQSGLDWYQAICSRP
jgi:hypothetical protein